MSRRNTHVPGIGLLALVAGVVISLVACSGEAGKYAGNWKRDLSGEGEVQMNLASNGGLELMLPSPRWPDSVDIKDKASFKGDTLIFKPDTAASACRTSEARYVVSRNADQLQIAGVGMDTCGGRRAALVGVWKKS
jgi:hypothetical protein